MALRLDSTKPRRLLATEGQLETKDFYNEEYGCLCFSLSFSGYCFSSCGVKKNQSTNLKTQLVISVRGTEL